MHQEKLINKLTNLVAYQHEKISFWEVGFRYLYVGFIFSLHIACIIFFIRMAFSVHMILNDTLHWQKAYTQLKKDYNELETKYIKLEKLEHTHN